MEVSKKPEKFYKILKKIEKIKNFPKNKLYISEKELKKHLTENEIIDLIKEGILKDHVLR